MLDHVALLTDSLERTLEKLRHADLPAGPIEEFPGEGTREVYLGEEGQAARLLLLQPLGDAGPYARAFSARGPGLHHVCLRVPDLEAFAQGLRGWLLHPVSLSTAQRSQTLWLARPGVATLVEVHEHDGPLRRPGVVASVEVPAEQALNPLLEDLTVGGQPVEGLLRSPDGQAWIRIGDERIELAGLCS